MKHGLQKFHCACGLTVGARKRREHTNRCDKYQKASESVASFSSAVVPLTSDQQKHHFELALLALKDVQRLLDDTSTRCVHNNSPLPAGNDTTTIDRNEFLHYQMNSEDIVAGK